MTPRFSLRPAEHLDTPDRKRDFNRALFTEVAPRYDFVTRALSLGRDGAWKRQLVGLLPALAAPACADLACGTGDLTRLLARRYPDGRVVGVDLTPSMLEQARRIPAPPSVEYRLGDLHDLPLPDASVDVLTGGYALRNAPDLDRALAEVARVVRPGGVAAFLDFSKPPSPVLQRISLGLLRFWGGLWGLLLHGNPDVYGYIADSLRAYPDRDALHRRLAEAGWRILHVRRPYLGLLEILVAQRADRR